MSDTSYLSASLSSSGERTVVTPKGKNTASDIIVPETPPTSIEEEGNDGGTTQHIRMRSESPTEEPGASRSDITKGPSSSMTAFVASTPFLSGNRKVMSANKFSNLDVTEIICDPRNFRDDDESFSDEDAVFEDKIEKHTKPRTLTSDDDVRAVTSSETEDSSGDVQVFDKYSEDEEVVVGARGPGPVRQQDIDFLTERMKLQTLESKKPLIKLLDEPQPPPQPRQPLLNKNEANEKYNIQPMHAAAREWLHDVSKSLSSLVEDTNQKPIPSEDLTEAEFVSPKRLKVELFPYQKYGVRWMTWREDHFPFGGILADEMGLGKTLMVMGVVLVGLEQGDNREDETENWLTPVSRKLVPTKATLVVCPASCVKQWESELLTKAKGLRVYVYHGSKRTDSAAVLSQHHVVICPYTTITAEIPKPDDDPYNKCRSPLLRLHWSRIVLDEGHVIRNHKTGGAQAICRLEAKRRWVVSGTPIHNKAEDFYSLVKYLRLRPFDEKDCWKYWIGVGNKPLVEAGRDRLHLIGNAITLRRIKADIKNCDIASLPPKQVEDVVLQLSDKERDVYDHLEEYAKQQFKKYQSAKEDNARAMQRAADNFVSGARRKNGGPDDPNAVKFSHMFALLTRLRQMSVLPFLIQTMLEGEEDGSDDEDESYDAGEDPINKKNPIFHIGFKSTKIRRVIQDVEAIRNAAKDGQPMDKIIIVSQWTTLLSIIQQHLQKKGFHIATITGKDSFEERAAAMKIFNENPKRPQILLLSLLAGGVGLNLVGANYVFFLEPHWNPQLERQAQDRVHRYGQNKQVFIRRYICEGTAEERVLNLQLAKLELADGLLDSTKKMSTGAGLNMNDMKSLFGLGNPHPTKK